MLAAGENPRYVGRRLIRMAAEDVGLAAPAVLVHAVAAFDAYERLGSPEGELALAQVTIELACAPKSNAAYTAYKAALGPGRVVRVAAAAAPHPECADGADARPRLRGRLCL